VDVSPLLLDTHAFAWIATEPDRLSAAAREALADRRRTLLVSAASPWEMAIKYRAGRWPEVAVLLRQYDDVLLELGAVERPVTADDGIRAGALAWEHGDPFDRMLAAQAIASGATMVSRDRVFPALPGLSVLW
jgi:PIN domain nuclease of toxin-antitoxin system